jgi:WD40 repeat protein
MDGKFLLTEARDLLPESDRLQVLVLEALALQHVPLKKWRRSRTRFLEPKARQARSLKNIAWTEYAHDDAEQRLPVSVHAFSITLCQNIVSCGLINGQIKIWNRETLKQEKVLTGHIQPVRAVVSWESFLISASDDTEIKVWDLASGRTESVLKGHNSAVLALTVSGDRLVSASRDQTLRIWKMGGAPVTWSCEHTLTGHTNDILCLTSFGGQAMSGSADKTIRIWVVGTGKFDMALEGHEGAIQALVAIRGRRLLSASRDKSIRMWSLKTGACERTIVVYPPQSIQSIACMAIVGSRLVGGSSSSPYSAMERYEVCVWEAETLTLEHTFKQPVGQMVSSFSAEEGRLWACIGPELVLWGNDAANEQVESDTDTSVCSSFFSPAQGGAE